DFHNNKIDIFDWNFQPVTTFSLIDPTLPPNFAPFNIVNIKDFLFVLYAKQKLPDKRDDEAGLGNGFINIFKPDGTFVKLFEHHESVFFASGPDGETNGLVGLIRAIH